MLKSNEFCFVARVSLTGVSSLRRIPKDLTESTLLGAVLSFLSLGAIVVLFWLNAKSMFDGALPRV